MSRLQVGFGRTFLMENVLHFDMGVQIAHDWHEYPRRHTTETKSLHIQVVINRKMPSPTTLFMDSALHCDRTGRKLCKMCMHWGAVDDATEKCRRCAFYLIPNDAVEAETFISKLKCNEVQWNYATTPFDESSQIGGTLTYTTKLTPSQAFRGNSSLLSCSKPDMDMPRFRLNQVRAFFAASLGENPIFNSRVCETIRSLLEPRDAKDRVFIQFMEAVFDGHSILFDRKTVLIASSFALVESELKMTFRLYLPAIPQNLDGRTIKISINEGCWAADRVIFTTFLCADPTSCLQGLRSENHFTQPVPIVVVPVKPVKAVKGAKAAKAIPAALKQIMALKKEIASASKKIKAEGKAASASSPSPSHSPSPFSPSCSSGATSSASSSSSKPADSFTDTPTSTSTSSSSSSSSASSSTFIDASDSSDTLQDNDINDADIDLDDNSPEAVAQALAAAVVPAAPAFHRIKSSSGDSRVVDTHDPLDVSLSGLFRSIMTDGMKMTTIFQGFSAEKITTPATSITALYTRHSDARNSIAGLMRVSTGTRMRMSVYMLMIYSCI